MARKPSWQIAIAVYAAYLVIVIGAMMAGGADYLNMTGPDVVFGSIVLPLILGAVFLFATISWLGWWKPVMRDSEIASPGWLKWPILLAAVGFIGLMLSDTAWSSLSGTHLLMLVIGAVFVGFNEEALTRGVMLVGFREGGRSEAWLLVLTALFFGLLHLPNALIGMPLWGAAVQVVFASIMGAGFYVLRRSTGMLLAPMIIHGLWDFSTFSHGASGADAPALQTIVQFGTYGVAILCAVILIWTMRGKKTGNSGAAPTTGFA